tara:strand:- start:281 stop:472 length:192 start_codon:yes stop_codon:yes gene_type:complete
MVEVGYKENSMFTFYIQLLSIIVGPQADGWRNMLSPEGLPSGYASALGLKPSGRSIALRQALR